MAQKEIITSRGQHIIADIGNVDRFTQEIRNAGFKSPTIVPPSDTFAIKLNSETPYQALVDHMTKSIIANPYRQLNVSRNFEGKPLMLTFGKDKMPSPMLRGNFSDAIIPGNTDLIAYRPDRMGGDMMGSRATFTYPDNTGGMGYLGSNENYQQAKIRAINNYIEAGNSNMGFLDEEFMKIGIDPYSTEQIDFDKMPDGAKRLKRFMTLTGWKEGLKFQDRFLKQQVANTQAYNDMVLVPARERSLATQKLLPRELRRYMLDLRGDLMRDLKQPVLDAHLTPSALAGDFDPVNPTGTEIIDMDAVREDVKARMRGNPTAVELGKLMNAAENLKVRAGLAPASEMLGSAGRFFAAAPVGHVSDVMNARLLTQVPGSGLDINTGAVYYPSELSDVGGVKIPKEAVDYAAKFHPDNASKNPNVSHEMRWKYYSLNAPKQNPYQSEMEARILDGYEQGDYKSRPFPFQNVPQPPVEAVIGSDSNDFDKLLEGISAY